MQYMQLYLESNSTMDAYHVINRALTKDTIVRGHLEVFGYTP
jgi:hypothetical protein